MNCVITIFVYILRREPLVMFKIRTLFFQISDTVLSFHVSFWKMKDVISILNKVLYLLFASFIYLFF